MTGRPLLCMVHPAGIQRMCCCFVPSHPSRHSKLTVITTVKYHQLHQQHCLTARLLLPVNHPPLLPGMHWTALPGLQWTVLPASCGGHQPAAGAHQHSTVLHITVSAHWQPSLH